MILVTQHLRGLSNGANPMISSAISAERLTKQIQMATVDCSLGNTIYRMKAAAMPSPGETVKNLIERFCSYDFTNRKGSVAERGGCYIVPLNESFNFGDNYSTAFSPKSSIGRTDTFVRVLMDHYSQYDRTDAGYHGPLYLEITPLSFNVAIAPLLEMTQFRVRTGECFISGSDLELLHAKHGVFYGKNRRPVENGKLDLYNGSAFFHIDLDREIVGFEAKDNPTETLDLSKTDHYDMDDFWVPIRRPKNREIVLTPGKFYLLTTKERVKIPEECCAEILPYDVSSGEFRTHYAGFFDNGFGAEFGTNVVLEVRARDLPQRIYDGQRICRMVFERTKEVPEKIYGATSGSSYTNEGASLSKHFKDRVAVWEE